MHNEIQPQKNDIVSSATTLRESQIFSRNEANQAWKQIPQDLLMHVQVTHTQKKEFPRTGQ